MYSYHLRQLGWPAGIEPEFRRIGFLFPSTATGLPPLVDLLILCYMTFYILQFIF